jgi:hypothetical protein
VTATLPDGRELARRAAALEPGLERPLGEVRVEGIAERAGAPARTSSTGVATEEDAALPDVLLVDGPATLSGPAQALRSTALVAADVQRGGEEGADLPRPVELQRRHRAPRGRRTGGSSRSGSRPSAASAARPPDDAGRLRAALVSGSCATAARVGLQDWSRDGWRGSPRTRVEAASALRAPAFAATAADPGS